MNCDLKERAFFIMQNFRQLQPPHPHHHPLHHHLAHDGHGVDDGHDPLLHSGEGFLLFHLLKNENADLEQFRELAGVSKAAISQMLSKLEKKGFITRSTDPEDRRRIIITPTKRSRLIYNHIGSRFDQFFDEIIERFGEDKLSQLVSLVEELSIIIKEMKGKL